MNQSETAAGSSVVLSSARGCFDVWDVIGSALLRGDLDQEWKDLLTLVDSERQADAARESANEAVLQEMSERFRIDRDLISAEETELWLEQRDLTLDDFSGHLLRHYWKEAGGSASRTCATPDYLSAPIELLELLRMEVYFSGRFEELANQFAWRVAARDESGDSLSDMDRADARSRLLNRLGASEKELSQWLEVLGRDESWLASILEMEAVFHFQAAAVTTPDELERAKGSLRLPLTRFVIESVEVESPDAAREALLCIREGESSVREVAALGGYAYREIVITLEELQEELHAAFLRAAPGEALGPFDLGECFRLCRVVEKSEPDWSDSEIRRRLEAEVLTRYFTKLAAKHVRWKINGANSG